MSTYELDDDLVRKFVDLLLPGGTGVNSVVADALRAQLSIPVPTKLGAVVRTVSGVYVRRIGNDNRERVWWRVPDGEWYTDAEIGHITEVLSEGVDV